MLITSIGGLSLATGSLQVVQPGICNCA